MEVQDQGAFETKDDIDIESKIRLLENEKKKIREEFDSQRAKMKELFLQKEDELRRKIDDNSKLAKDLHQLQSELDDVKSQLCVANIQLEANVEDTKRKAAEEIATLQQLVHETVEESSCSRSIYTTEVNKLHELIDQLEKENLELRTELQHSPYHTVSEQSSLVPSVMINAVTKKLAKKLGADAFMSQENTDDNISKNSEDELLKSIVAPLEEEIKALKDKLRATDAQLQKCRQCGHFPEQEIENRENQQSTATNTSFDGEESHTVCDMCSNYEAHLVNEQQRVQDLQAKVATAEKAAERHREDLLKEIGFRKDMEEKWNEKKEEHKQQVIKLTTRTECAEQDLKELQETFKHACAEVNHNLNSLKVDRDRTQTELIKLQNENDNLVGKYSMHSQQLQSEMINFPNTVDELQELLLKSHQDLIIAKIGKEEAEEKENALRSDIVIRESVEASLQEEINSLKLQLEQLEDEKDQHLKRSKLLDRAYNEAKEKLNNAQSVHEELVSTKIKLEEQNSELKTRINSLQQELDTSETVQKDFVRLSQSLQVQLEKIRDSDTQVRWQHDEDVDECPACRSGFAVTKRKEHCRHCGQIFCSRCLTHTVPSGPKQRLSKVCDVCHTLLVKSSAPYFSTEAPHSPD
ncbi:rab gtpase-binding effector protein [Holotrichia oblita]|uniref:Rab gtpase-binding effector protein n=1 Tax=Holotrichia oblita TaxID=644536 RepID=A0ACB9SMD6_HOLOL|nr:rab gtpase-binding effector protein [Holotrichia oblita]